MDLTRYLIGFVIFSLVTMTAILFITDANNQYGTTIGQTQEFTELYTESNQTMTTMHDTTLSMRQGLFNNSASLATRLDSIISGGFSSISFVQNTFGVISTITDTVAKAIGIPQIMVDATIIIILIVVILTIIYFFTGRQ